MANGSIAQLINELGKLDRNITNNVKKYCDEAADIAITKSVNELLKPVPDKFKDVIDEFYNAYDPSYYDRRESMYDILRLSSKRISNGEVSVVLGFDDSGMSFRKGGTAFQLSFVEGYHGGAVGTDHNGVGVDVPTYRWPPDKYYWWGNPAFKSDSPYEKFDKWMEQYWEGNTFQTIFENNFNSALERILSSNAIFG